MSSIHATCPTDFALFQQGYITCAWGVSKIGYVLICYGLSDAVFSAAFGHIMHFIGKTVICSIEKFAMCERYFLSCPN